MAINKTFLTVVSGLPRSGTSMMMRVLEAGGVPPQIDELREANEDNPNGYYEFEPVKALKEDDSWVPGACGKAVKIIYKLVYDLPQGTDYRVIFMQRDVEEVVRSQEKMLERDGLDPGIEQHDMISALFQSEIIAFRNWIATQPNIAMYVVDYRSFIEDPAGTAAGIAQFLELDLNVQAMAEVVDPDLYRNRAS